MAITKLPVYQDIIKIGRERENAIFVDVGCCLSTESRRVAADGFPACNIVAFDLKKEFLQLSHVLFRSTKETYPGHFIAGDALDPAILDVAPPARGSIQEPPPDLSTLTSLNPLRGHCSVINASAFFSCFSEELQLRVARAVGGLLSPVPGSIICGYQPGAITKGKYIYPFLGNDVDIFCHSPETWMELWNGTVFAKGEVEVATHLAEISVFGVKRHVLMWSVRRL
ncbi:hypothetical protein ID866_11511 [Astraeus odoratus]|nr:hypothetical protein ID866_11511 [Astraeus odoratus]